MMYEMKKLPLIIIVILLITVSCGGCSQIKNAANKTLTINIGNNNGGSGNVNPEYGSHEYKSHQVVTVTATASPGSVFIGWMGIDGVLTEKSAVDPAKSSSGLDYKINVVMSQNVTLTPLFAKAGNLSITVNGSGSVRITKVQGMGGFDATRYTGDVYQGSGSHIYADGEYVTFTISPSAAVSFTGWTGDLSQVDPKYLPPTLPFTGAWMIPLDPLTTTVTVYMNQDINLTANFK
jgi:hypothetical protein